MTAPKLTEAQKRCLNYAANDPRCDGSIVIATHCMGLHNAAQHSLIMALSKKGFAARPKDYSSTWAITDAGRAALRGES